MRPHYHTHPNTHEAFIGVWGWHGLVQTTVPRLPVEFEKPPHLLTPCRVQSQIFRTQAINTFWHQLSNGALPENYPRWGWLSEPFLCAYPSFTLTDTVIQKVPPHPHLQYNHQLRHSDSSRRKLAENLLGTFNSFDGVDQLWCLGSLYPGSNTSFKGKPQPVVREHPSLTHAENKHLEFIFCSLAFPLLVNL